MVLVRTVLLALIGFMPTPGGGAIGALDHTPEERKVMARRYNFLNFFLQNDMIACL